MPRDGSGVYTHPFPDVAQGTTIESAVFNGNTADVEQDLNEPRPILAGGTGARNARDAMIALRGEIALQGPVTNFADFPFVNGSWYCNTDVTGAPTAENFHGIYFSHVNTDYAVIEAWALGSGIHYMKVKSGGVWPATWTRVVGAATDLDTRFVNVDGDTMTGALNVPSIRVGATALPHPLAVKTGAGYNMIAFDGGSGATGFGSLNDAQTAWGGITTYSGWTFTSTVNVGGAVVISGTLNVAGNLAASGNITTPNINVSGTTTTANLSASGNVTLLHTIGSQISQAGPGQVMIQSAGSGNHAMLTLHNAGSFAGNLGFIGADLYMGGWSFGTGTQYRFWTTKDFTTLPQPNLGYTPLNTAGGTMYGGLTVNGEFVTAANYIRFGVSGSAQYLIWDGGQFVFNGGPLNTPSGLTVEGVRVYGGIPQAPGGINAWSTAADSNKMLAGTGVAYIDDNAHPPGTCLSFCAWVGGTLTIVCNATLWFNNGSTVLSGNRVLADRGLATAWKIGGGNWIIGGNGLT